MTGTTEDIIKGLPYPEIPKINGEPTFDDLKNLKNKLDNNAGSVPTNLGGGAHGYLALTTPGNTFFALTGAIFQPPIDPGPLPQIPQNATSAQIGHLERTHKEARRQFQEFIAVGNALRQQLLTAVDETYLRGLRHPVYGFVNVSVLQMLTYLFDNYGDIEPGDLTENNRRLTAAYDVSAPIETLWEQIEEAMAYAAAANAPYTAQQINNTAYDLLFKTGQFKDELKEWRRRPAGQQTWPEFKRLMTRAHRDLHRQSAATMGYHTANNVGHDSGNQQTNHAFAATAAALEGLAEATQSDRSAVANLTAANNTLTDQVKVVYDMKKMISELTNEVKQLKQAMKNVKFENGNTVSTPYNNNNNNNGNNNGNSAFKRVKTKWCWSCGVNRGHTSDSCKYQAPGHQVKATPDNMMGSNPFGMNHA